MSTMPERAPDFNSAVERFLLQPSYHQETEITTENEDLGNIVVVPKQLADSDASQNWRSYEVTNPETSSVLSSKPLQHDSVIYQSGTLSFDEEQQQTVSYSQPHPWVDDDFDGLFEQLSEQFYSQPIPITEQTSSANPGYFGPYDNDEMQASSREKKGIEEYQQEVEVLKAQMKKTKGDERKAIQAKIARKKNTIACILYRQKQKTTQKANAERIKELEQELKTLKEDSLRNAERTKTHFGMILQSLLQASPEHVSQQAKEYIFTEWSKINMLNNHQR